MKKNLVAYGLAAAMLLTGCGSSAESGETIPASAAATTTTTTAPETTMAETQPETTAPKAIETDEKLFTVEITFPASMFEGEDMSSFDPDAYAAENGFISAKVNDDGSIKVKMSKAKHDDLLREMAANLDENFSTMARSEETPYITEITHNDDFSEVNIIVVRSEYEQAFDLTPFSVGISAMFYQKFVDMDLHVEINVVDADTHEAFKTIIYPDALEQASEAMNEELNQ